jgi:hypothetical protein
MVINLPPHLNALRSRFVRYRWAMEWCLPAHRNSVAARLSPREFKARYGVRSMTTDATPFHPWNAERPTLRHDPSTDIERSKLRGKYQK